MSGCLAEEEFLHIEVDASRETIQSCSSIGIAFTEVGESLFSTTGCSRRLETVAEGNARHVYHPRVILSIKSPPLILAIKVDDMEQSGISIIPTTTIADNTVGKSKSIGITLRPNCSIQVAKEKLVTQWLSNLMKEDASGWEILLVSLAEMIGTAILVFLGCAGCIGSLDSKPSILQTSLTFGFAVMIAIQCMGHISGAHINPCITIASLILGKKSLPMCLFYIVSQCVGALLGYSLLKVITPDQLIYSTDPNQRSDFCMTTIHPGLTTLRGFMGEFIATAILVLFACGLWDCRNVHNTDSAPLRFGLCIAVLCFVFSPYTGCSMNPARTFGPAVWNNYWQDHWVFWVAPLSAAVLASVVYRCLFDCKVIQDDSGQSLNGVRT